MQVSTHQGCVCAGAGSCSHSASCLCPCLYPSLYSCSRPSMSGVFTYPELRSLLGIINYYSKFLPNLSAKLAPFYQLLRKGVKW